MGGRDVASVERPRQAGPRDSVFLPGGAFRMGSDKHYPEEAPVHRVVVEGFRIDRTPVTNRQFKEFVRTTGHKTFAEVPPDPKNYPDALPGQPVMASRLAVICKMTGAPDRAHPTNGRTWKRLPTIPLNEGV